MAGQFGQVMFIVWRESVEALLVIGILNAWLGQQQDSEIIRRGRRFLWLGVAAGVALAGVLGGTLLAFSEVLPEDGQEYFQTGMVLVAAALILQMIFWMRRHGRTLKRDLESDAARSVATANWWGLLVLAMVAVAREGSETAIFLYGILASDNGSIAGSSIAAAVLGLGVAGLTYWLLQIGSRRISWRIFFRVTEILLLFLAAALVMSGIDHLVSVGLIPPLSGPLWDSSAVLDDSGIIGGMIAGLTGYRAHPDLTTLIVYAGYWGLVAWVFQRNAGRRERAA
jgi:high-affinity iron transporter